MCIQTPSSQLRQKQRINRMARRRHSFRTVSLAVFCTNIGLPASSQLFLAASTQTPSLASSYVLRPQQTPKRRVRIPQAQPDPMRMRSSPESPVESLVVNAFKRYLALIDRRPWETQAASSGIVSVLGDILSQWIEAHVAHEKFVLDWLRLHAFFWSGALFVGTFVHLWFQQLWRLGRWMERKYQWKQNSWRTTLLQMIVDQTIGVAMFFPTYFYVYELCDALVSLRAPMLSLAHFKCKEQIGSLLLIQYYVWPAANWAIFALVRENLRVLASNVVAVFWNAYLCAVVA